MKFWKAIIDYIHCVISVYDVFPPGPGLRYSTVIIRAGCPINSHRHEAVPTPRTVRYVQLNGNMMAAMSSCVTCHSHRASAIAPQLQGLIDIAHIRVNIVIVTMAKELQLSVTGSKGQLQ